MSNSTNKLLTDMISEELPELSPINNGTEVTNTFLGLTWTTWIIIILILTLLGFNIFAYLAKGTEETASLFSRFIVPILNLFGYETLETTKQTIETSAIGTKAGVDIVAGTTTSAIEKTQQQLGQPQSKLTEDKVPVQDELQQTHHDSDSWGLEKALDDAGQTRQNYGVLPDEAQSTIQASTGKAGWCYIGDDNGFRACSEIGVNDVCMSGDVFPTRAVCMNPNLRA